MANLITTQIINRVLNISPDGTIWRFRDGYDGAIFNEIVNKAPGKNTVQQIYIPSTFKKKIRALPPSVRTIFVPPNFQGRISDKLKTYVEISGAAPALPANRNTKDLLFFSPFGNRNQPDEGVDLLEYISERFSRNLARLQNENMPNFRLREINLEFVRKILYAADLVKRYDGSPESSPEKARLLEEINAYVAKMYQINRQRNHTRERDNVPLTLQIAYNTIINRILDINLFNTDRAQYNEGVIESLKSFPHQNIKREIRVMSNRKRDHEMLGAEARNHIIQTLKEINDLELLCTTITREIPALRCEFVDARIHATLTGALRDEHWAFIYNVPVYRFVIDAKTKIQNIPAQVESLVVLQDVSLPRLPVNLRVLELGTEYKSRRVDFPASLHKLLVGDGYNFNIDCSRCGELTVIQIGNGFNSVLRLPVSVERLTIGHNFNRELEISHCQNLRRLSLGNSFMQNIDWRNLNLEYIRLGNRFNGELIVNKDAVYELVLGDEFDKEIHWTEYTNIGVLQIGNKYNKKFENYPPNLRELRLGTGFNQPLGRLPGGLRKIILECEEYNSRHPILYPESMEEFIINGVSVNLPEDEESRYRELLEMIGDASRFVELEKAFYWVEDKIIIQEDEIDGEEVLSLQINQNIYAPILENINATRLPYQGYILDINYREFVIDELPNFVTELFWSCENHPNIGVGNNLRRIHFLDNFNVDCDLKNVNPFIKEIYFGNAFNSAIENLPMNLIELKIGHGFNREILLNDNLETLSIGDMYNMDLFLPAQIKEIVLGNSFNQNIFIGREEEPNKFTKEITFLGLGNSFNRPIDISECNNLETINLGDAFNQEISFPRSLKTIIIGDAFNHDIEDLPPLIEILRLGSGFKSVINYGQYDSLIELTVPNTTKENLTNIKRFGALIARNIRENMKDLQKVSKLLNRISGVKTEVLEAGGGSLTVEIGIDAVVSPEIYQLFNEINILDMNYYSNVLLSHVPKSVKILKINTRECPVLNDAIEILSLGNNFTEDLPRILPQTLRELHIGNGFNGHISNVVTDTLEVLRIGNSFNQSIVVLQNTRILHLVLGDAFDQPLFSDVNGKSYLPPTIERLELGASFSHDFPLDEPFVRMVETGNFVLKNARNPYKIPTRNELRKYPFNFYDIDYTTVSNNVDWVILFKVSKLYNYSKLFVPFNIPISILPESLKVLKFDDSFNQNIPQLPPFLEILEIGSINTPIELANYNCKLPDILPKSLKTLIIGNAFNKPLPILPIELTDLWIGHSFDNDLDISYTNCKTLYLGDSFNKNIQFNYVLENITFGRSYIYSWWGMHDLKRYMGFDDFQFSLRRTRNSLLYICFESLNMESISDSLVRKEQLWNMAWHFSDFKKLKTFIVNDFLNTPVYDVTKYTIYLPLSCDIALIGDNSKIKLSFGRGSNYDFDPTARKTTPKPQIIDRFNYSLKLVTQSLKVEKIDEELYKDIFLKGTSSVSMFHIQDIYKVVFTKKSNEKTWHKLLEFYPEIKICETYISNIIIPNTINILLNKSGEWINCGPNIKTVVLSGKYNYKLPLHLPTTLKKIIIENEYYDRELPPDIPDSIDVIFKNKYYRYMGYLVYRRLKTATDLNVIVELLNRLSTIEAKIVNSSVLNITVYQNKNWAWRHLEPINNIIRILNIRSTVREMPREFPMNIGYLFINSNSPIPALPPNLIYLNFGEKYNSQIPLNLPNTLREIKILNPNYEHEVPMLPPNIQLTIASERIRKQYNNMRKKSLELKPPNNNNLSNSRFGLPLPSFQDFFKIKINESGPSGPSYKIPIFDDPLGLSESKPRLPNRIQMKKDHEEKKKEARVKKPVIRKRFKVITKYDNK